MFKKTLINNVNTKLIMFSIKGRREEAEGKRQKGRGLLPASEASNPGEDNDCLKTARCLYPPVLFID